jgi:ribosome assembly protein RRB1
LNVKGSSDGTIKFIDFRVNKKTEWAGNIKASDSDVNVISWNSYKPNLLASGCDDGTIQIWDIRYVNKGRSIAEIQWHKEPITSIEFQPFEDSVVSASCADNRVTIWDFSVEADVKHKNQDIPEQLMFVHQGIIDVKEIK